MPDKVDLLISETMNGRILKDSCKCCVKISFKYILWTMHIKTFYIFKDYIKDLLDEKHNETNVFEHKVLLGMQDTSLMVWVTFSDLQEIHKLTELAVIELKREEFMNSFSKNDSIKGHEPKH